MVSWWIKKKGGTPPGDLENLLVSWWINSPGDQEIFSWWGTTYFFKINQETKKFFCPPGGLIHQETRRFSPGGVPYFFNPPGDKEILLSSWWINSPGDKEIFSLWGTIPFFNPLGDQEILLVSWWINSPGDKEIFSWWGVILFLIHQETKRFFCSPGGLLHQETRRFSPSGYYTFF